jgi:hypothetical protein
MKYFLAVRRRKEVSNKERKKAQKINQPVENKKK